MFSYRAFGLNINSDIEIPELTISSDAETDVKVKYAKVIDFTSSLESKEDWYCFINGSLFFLIDKVGRFKVSGGCLIEIDRFNAATDDDIRLFLLGSGIGGVLHQRGVLPLHASAIEIDGEAVLFSADSGFGKSTICLGFQNEGYSVVSDDICAIDIQKNKVKVCPGYPQLKLWKDSVHFFGLQSHSLNKVTVDEDKFKLEVKHYFQKNKLKIRAIFFLEKGIEKDIIISELFSLEKINKLQQNIFRPYFAKSEKSKMNHFYEMVSIGNGVPFFKLIRPQNGFHTKEIVKEVLKILDVR